MPILYGADSARNHPLETWYNGIRFNSRLEARWALFLDVVGLCNWQYESEGFRLPGWRGYLPDFHVPHLGYLEIKPSVESDNGKIAECAYPQGKPPC